MQTLFVGCSFLDNLKKKFPRHPQYHILSSAGSGNQAIAAQVVHQIAQQKYNRVVVLWSGVNRLDFPVPTALHQTWKKSNWIACREIGDATWYHSGGMIGSGLTDSVPQVIRQWFYQQYLGCNINSKYLSELTLTAIANTQAVLELQGIDYCMSFIYNIDQGSVGTPHEASHGVLDRTLPISKLINWNKFTAQTAPYEWCSDKNWLDEDEYHPTALGMVNWLHEQMNIDIVL